MVFGMRKSSFGGPLPVCAVYHYIFGDKTRPQAEFQNQNYPKLLVQTGTQTTAVTFSSTVELHMF